MSKQLTRSLIFIGKSEGTGTLLPYFAENGAKAVPNHSVKTA